ncbi:MAG: hypothetical protein JNK76_19335 [Planctomycetales bacterium]|nr:hypothetical protein [Planctomycetales bacterium]
MVETETIKGDWRIRRLGTVYRARRTKIHGGEILEIRRFAVRPPNLAGRYNAADSRKRAFCASQKRSKRRRKSLFVEHEFGHLRRFSSAYIGAGVRTSGAKKCAPQTLD